MADREEGIMVVLATRKYKAGYEVREEVYKTNFEAFPITDSAQREVSDD